MISYKNNVVAYLINIFVLASLLVFYSCRNRDYITYYNEVNKIDSIYRFQKHTLTVIKKYRKLFRKYMPKNQDRIEEFKTFIILSDKYHKSFGRKKTLMKFTSTIAPYGNLYKEYFTLCIFRFTVNRKVYISDPSYGLITYAPQEFIKFWIGENAYEKTEVSRLTTEAASNDLYKNIHCLFCIDYFPIQNLEKMLPSTSSFVTSPEISPRCSRAFLNS